MQKRSYLYFCFFIHFFHPLFAEETTLAIPYIAEATELCDKNDNTTSISSNSFPYEYLISKKLSSKNLRLSRKEHIASEMLLLETTCFLEGYIQALIDANYYENYVVVEVDEERVVTLFNLPSDGRIRNSIISFVRDIPSIKDVKVREKDDKELGETKKERFNHGLVGVFFPETTVLFEPLIANPRDPVYSIAYRWGDNVLAKDQIAVSLGDIFPLYRFFNVFGGDLQIDIGVCMWANFDMNPANQPNGEWAELITTDYILSIPLSYARNNYSFRLRAYHISSHLGDEYMVNNPDHGRVNPSFEAIDFFGSYQFRDSLRVYIGPGFIVNSDQSFPMKYFYFEYGLEFRPFVQKYNHPRLYGTPFFALDCQNWQINNYRPSLTLQLGYEWSKLERAGRNVRIFVEYHNGYSEGQFFDQMLDYWAIRGAWGF
jgi:hypothetical protein